MTHGWWDYLEHVQACAVLLGPQTVCATRAPWLQDKPD